MIEMKIGLPGGHRVDVELAGHVVRTDQSRQSGGEGAAPEPFALFLASIGACAGAYVQGFCKARGISTEGIGLVERVDFDPASGRLKTVAIDIELPAGFPDRYVDAVRRAADACAVKKAILDPPELRVSATRASG